METLFQDPDCLKWETGWARALASQPNYLQETHSNCTIDEAVVSSLADAQELVSTGDTYCTEPCPSCWPLQSSAARRPQQGVDWQRLRTLQTMCCYDLLRPGAAAAHTSRSGSTPREEGPSSPVLTCSKLKATRKSATWSTFIFYLWKFRSLWSLIHQVQERTIACKLVHAHGTCMRTFSKKFSIWGKSDPFGRPETRIFLVWRNVFVLVFCRVCAWNVDDMIMSFCWCFSPGFVPNTSDDEGRYQFANQPGAGYFNLDKLRVAMGTLFNDSRQSVEILTLFWLVDQQQFLIPSWSLVDQLAGVVNRSLPLVLFSSVFQNDTMHDKVCWSHQMLQMRFSLLFVFFCAVMAILSNTLHEEFSAEVDPMCNDVMIMACAHTMKKPVPFLPSPPPPSLSLSLSLSLLSGLKKNCSNTAQSSSRSMYFFFCCCQLYILTILEILVMYLQFLSDKVNACVLLLSYGTAWNYFLIHIHPSQFSTRLVGLRYVLSSLAISFFCR